MIFRDRHDAGRRLARELVEPMLENPVVVALPRGGVPVGFEVARALGAPLDVLAVRKLGAPGQPELAIGAIAEEDVGVLDPEMARRVGTDEAGVQRIRRDEAAELRRRVQLYRDDRPAISLVGRTAIVVDDGLATGLTDLAAVRAVRRRGAARVIVAAPVGSRQGIELLREEADRVVCITVPRLLDGVGRWYSDFSEVSDAEVLALLADRTDESVALELDGLRLEGDLVVPSSAVGLVVFAHGSGSSRRSVRNRAVAQALNRAGLATLLLDLLTESEARQRELVFDIPLLARRVAAVSRWTRRDARLAHLPLGLFGASTGAAAALVAAAEEGATVHAVVSRGGRPDLAAPRLPLVTAATLLIVGGRDLEVLELNRRAAEELRCLHQLVIVPGAGHLFEEPDALEAVAAHAVDWFTRHLPATAVQAA